MVYGLSKNVVTLVVLGVIVAGSVFALFNSSHWFTMSFWFVMSVVSVMAFILQWMTTSEEG